MNGKLLAIVRREYLERVRSKSFVVATILGPLLMAGLMVVPAIMATRSGKPLRVAVVDEGGALQAAAEQALRAARFDDKPRFSVVPSDGSPAAVREAALRKQVLARQLDGYVVLPAAAAGDAVGGKAAGVAASYFGRNVSNQIDLRTMKRALSDLLLGERLHKAGLEPERIKQLTRELELKTLQLSEKGEREERGAAILLAIVLMMILYMSILMWGQAVMTGVIEEKGSRVIEVLASGLPATQLLAGKLLGIGAAGLTQLVVWTASLAALSLAPVPSSPDFSLPDLSPFLLLSFVVFYLLGFLLYAAFYAAIGSAVNTVQEAQNFVFPVLLPLIAGLVCFPVVLQAPDSGLAIFLSLVPLIAPLIMFLRIIVLSPPLWQVALSVVLLLGAIAAVLWLAARIYRVGILMYGKKPTFPELMKWVRHS
jgi:ABC-2 type transport system permease protein